MAIVRELTAGANTEVRLTSTFHGRGVRPDHGATRWKRAINNGDKAAIRSLLVGGTRVAHSSCLHRGVTCGPTGANSVLTTWLSAGSHTLTLAYTPADRNMMVRSTQHCSIMCA